jgi:hypothetical protein
MLIHVERGHSHRRAGKNIGDYIADTSVGQNGRKKHHVH